MTYIYLEFYVEDESGKIFLEEILRKILESYQFNYRVFAYQGKKNLLKKLPKLLRAASYRVGKGLDAVIFLVDADSEDCHQLKENMRQHLDGIYPKPHALFRIAIEEMEAWFLGDKPAVKKAFPQADDKVLRRYKQDSCYGTWELLAKALDKEDVQNKSFHQIGLYKAEWAQSIAPHMNVEKNESPSFKAFRDGLRALVQKIAQA